MPTPDGHAGHGDSHGGYPIDGCENRVEFSSVQSAATEPPGEVDTISTETETIAKIREIICMDAMEWLAQSDSLPSVMTSMPDMTESTQHMQWGGPEAYKAWFVDTAKMILQKLRPGCAAVFYQSDSILVDDSGYMSQYMDKGFLCSLAAHEVGSPMMWHKIALRNPVGAVRVQQCYTHMCCFMSPKSPDQTYHVEACQSCPDVIARGDMSWSKATGVEAAWHVVNWLKESLRITELVDPFCGEGTIPAIAEHHGLSAIGVELSEKRCRLARKLQIAKQGKVHVAIRFDEKAMFAATGLRRNDLGPTASKSRIGGMGHDDKGP